MSSAWNGWRASAEGHIVSAPSPPRAAVGSCHHTSEPYDSRFFHSDEDQAAGKAAREGFNTPKTCGVGRRYDAGRNKACILAEHAVTSAAIEAVIASHPGEGARMGPTKRKRKVDEFMMREHGVDAPLGRSATSFSVQLYTIVDGQSVPKNGTASHGHTKRVFMGFEVVDPDGTPDA